jgi:hypothetical protein
MLLRACVAVSIVCLPSVALAYIPPAGFIVGKLAEKRATIAVNELEVFAETAYGGAEPVTEKILLKRPYRLRWSRPEGEGEWVYVYKEGEAAEVTPAGEVKRGRVEFEPLAELLAPKAQADDPLRDEYLSVLKRLQIDPQTVSLARFASRVAYVIGASSKDRDRHQLWIDKDSFQPVRVLYRGEHDGRKGMWDVQLREFGARETGDAFPRVIEKYFDGKLVSHTEVEKVQTQTKLPEASFQLPGVKAK